MRTSNPVQNQHVVNLAVLLVSAVAAWVAPLQTFLIAYAVLGPFHYLTEIAWLQKKDFYFGDGIIPPRLFLAITLALCSVACLDLYFRRGWAAYAIGGLIVLSLGSLVKNVPVLLVTFVVLVAVRFFFHGYGLFLAVFVPTVVHVYLFTLIFLISGAMRGTRRTLLAWLNPLLLLTIPLLLIHVGLGSGLDTPGRYWMSSETTFAAMHEYIAGMIGLGMHFNPSKALEPNAIAVFRVLAFIYLHHYLNWFAKTELLAWHKVSRPTWFAIGVMYLAAIGSYAYSFAVGFYAAYFLSMLHVLLEFPLDWRGAAGIVLQPWNVWRTKNELAAVNTVEP